MEKDVEGVGEQHGQHVAKDEIGDGQLGGGRIEHLETDQMVVKELVGIIHGHDVEIIVHELGIQEIGLLIRLVADDRMDVVDLDATK